MKKIIVAFMLFCTHTVLAQSEKSISNTDIKDVKIFLSGAEINRSFKTTVDAGITQLVVENLSPEINRNSISAILSGDAMVLSTFFSLNYLKENKTSPVLKKLRDSLDVLNDNIGELNILKSVYTDEAAMLNANKQVGGSNVGLTAENLQKVIDFFRTRMIDIKGKLSDVDKKMMKLNEKIKKVNDQINEENGKLNQPSGAIFVTISSKQKANISIDLSYYANGASWKPSYDLRATDVNSPVSLMYKASVSQNTGENWDNVRVSLSTGNPSLTGIKPELNKWYLRFMTPQYKNRMSAAPSAVQESVIAYDAIESSGKMEDNSLASSVQIQESQIVTEFIIQIPYTVKSDGKEVQMDIQSYSLPATYAYYAAPKLDKDAFLVASITGWEKLNLLPGPSNVYLENSYVGQSFINPLETEDTLKLSFGRDKRIVIKREKVKDMNTTKFFGNNVEKEFLYEITVRNTKKENITITLQDQLPLTTDEAIKITNGELSNGNYISETGMINWKLDVKTGETKKVRLGYKVKYPKDKVIPGL